jgi:hypothetical protein
MQAKGGYLRVLGNPRSSTPPQEPFRGHKLAKVASKRATPLAPASSVRRSGGPSSACVLSQLRQGCRDWRGVRVALQAIARGNGFGLLRFAANEKHVQDQLRMGIADYCVDLPRRAIAANAQASPANRRSTCRGIHSRGSGTGSVLRYMRRGQSPVNGGGQGYVW